MMKKEKVKVYIYTRVSTAMQIDGYSLDAQKSRMKAYAEFNDYEIVGEYEDAGKSGKSIEGRVEFNRMMEDIKSGKDGVSYVLVFKLSRFGRNAADVLSTLQVMQDFGVNLICVEDGIDSSKDAGKLMISVLSAVAEIERENIRVQTMEGRIQKAREGKWNGGFAPYGYKLEKGQLFINEEEAAAIRVIFDQYVHTDNPMLNARGKKILRSSYSVLQDDFFHFMRVAGYTDLERGERGSTEEHLTVTQFKVQAEQQRLEAVTGQVAQAERSLENAKAATEKQKKKLEALQKETKTAKTVALTVQDIEAMGKKATFGNNITLTPDECRTLKDYAVSSFAEKAEKIKYKQKFEQAEKSAKTWKQRYDALHEQYQELKKKAQPFLDALEIASERVRAFLDVVLSRGKETQEHEHTARKRGQDMEL